MRTPMFLVVVAALFAFGCDSTKIDDVPRMFTVTVTNVSAPATIASDRAGGTVPLSPPVYSVFVGDNPMFESGELANVGTERIAEDGFPEEMLAILSAAPNVSLSGVLTAEGGPDAGPAFFAGESASFTFTAEPGDKLQLETMFVQSNDWFYSFSDGGLELWDANGAIDGDVTSRLTLYDAGTEMDTAPGTGPVSPPGGVQKPVQDPDATNVGDDESVVIQPAADRHNFTIPQTSDVIQITISSVEAQ